MKEEESRICPECGAELKWDEFNELWYCPECEYWRYGNQEEAC